MEIAMLNRRVLLTSSAMALLAGTFPARPQHADLEPLPEAQTDDPPRARRYMMEDTYGNVITNEDMQGRFVLILFGYMSCPDVCPTSLAVAADVLKLLEEDAEGLSVLFVSVDPKRDNAKQLREYVHFFDERIIALRGPKAYTDHMVKTFNARYEIHMPDPAQPEEYSVDHTASAAFVAPDGTLIKRFPFGLEAPEIADEIRAAIQAAKEN